MTITAHSCVRAALDWTVGGARRNIHMCIYKCVQNIHWRIPSATWSKSNFPFVSFILWAKLVVCVRLRVYGGYLVVSAFTQMHVRMYYLQMFTSHISSNWPFVAYWCRFFSFLLLHSKRMLGMYVLEPFLLVLIVLFSSSPNFFGCHSRATWLDKESVSVKRPTVYMEFLFYMTDKFYSESQSLISWNWCWAHACECVVREIWLAKLKYGRSRNSYFSFCVIACQAMARESHVCVYCRVSVLICCGWRLHAPNTL